METMISNIKDAATIILAVTATVISILAYRRARATILQPIKTEVIKKQSQILSEVLTILPNNESKLIESLDYMTIATANALIALVELGFVFEKQEELLGDFKKDIVGSFWMGEGHVMPDVEVLGIFTPEAEKQLKTNAEKQKKAKERFEKAKAGVVKINRIDLTKTHWRLFEKLEEYAENPFVPTTIQDILKTLITDITTNLRVHLRGSLEEFVRQYCKRYFSEKTRPTPQPIGAYNIFNHMRIHHIAVLTSLRTEVRNYLQIDKKW